MPSFLSRRTAKCWLWTSASITQRSSDSLLKEVLLFNGHFKKKGNPVLIVNIVETNGTRQILAFCACLAPV